MPSDLEAAVLARLSDRPDAVDELLARVIARTLESLDHDTDDKELVRQALEMVAEGSERRTLFLNNEHRVAVVKQHFDALCVVLDVSRVLNPGKQRRTGVVIPMKKKA